MMHGSFENTTYKDHIEILISASEMLEGSGACSPRKFGMIDAI